MENAFDALKMAFAVIVFVIALAIAFSLLTQANATAQQIFFGMDKVTYLDHERVEGLAEHRIVGLETIIPTIYRYSVENCGVTIIDKDGKIVARYDVETENVASNYGNFKEYKPDIVKYSAPKYRTAFENYCKHIGYLVDVLDKLGSLQDKQESLATNKYDLPGNKYEDEGCKFSEEIDGNEVKYSYNNDLANNILPNLYKYKIENNDGFYYGAPWGSDYVAERLEADLNGKKINFGNQIYDGKRFDGKGLLEQIKDKKYQEYIIEQDTEYIAKNYADKVGEDTEDSDNVKSTKLEIFYIEVKEK